MAVGSSYGDQLRAKKRVTLLLSDAIDRQEAIERRRSPQRAWQTSPVNILNMPNPSATPSRRVDPPRARTVSGRTDEAVQASRGAVPTRPPAVSGNNSRVPVPRRKSPRGGQTPRARERAVEMAGAGKTGGSSGRGTNPSSPGRASDGDERRRLKGRTCPSRYPPLGFDDRGIAYGRLLKTATPAQLEKLGYWKERRRKRHMSKAAPRALPSDADARTQKRCGERAKDRALARDVERLIEECETLQQQQKGGGFPAIDWRPFTSRKRWRDGGRGWMGLKEGEVRSTDVVGVGGGDVSSEKEKEKKKKKKKVPTEVAKAVLRARFTTCFPRAADKRACAGDGAMGT